jgi:membrane protease YdiL (CAAX protease family)
MNAKHSAKMSPQARTTGSGEAAPPHAKRKRKSKPPPLASAWTARYALGAYVLVVAVAGAAAAALSSHELRLGLGIILVDVVMIATLVPLRRADRVTARSLGLRPSASVRSVGLVLLAVLVVIIVGGIWDHHAASQQPATPVLASPGEDTATAILGGFAAVVCAPVVEEIFFRGLLYRSLRNRMGIVRAAVLAGILFGAAHATTYPLHSLPPKMVFGVVACLVYEYSGSLYPCIALHSFVDGAAFELAISHNDRLVLFVFLALGASLLVYGGARRRRALAG